MKAQLPVKVDSQEVVSGDDVFLAAAVARLVHCVPEQWLPQLFFPVFPVPPVFPVFLLYPDSPVFPVFPDSLVFPILPD